MTIGTKRVFLPDDYMHDVTIFLLVAELCACVAPVSARMRYDVKRMLARPRHVVHRGHRLDGHVHKWLGRLLTMGVNIKSYVLVPEVR